MLFKLLSSVALVVLVQVLLGYYLPPSLEVVSRITFYVTLLAAILWIATDDKF